jgi:1-acyl-sn-glycerol-3-phosphate acyltransferase
MYPEYSYPLTTILQAARDWVFLRRRSFKRDSQACIGRLKPSLRVLGGGNIPQSGPCLITFNHYFRPGFGAWWLALALAATVPVDIHFIMTGELTFPGKWYAPLGMFFSHTLLERAARMYGFTPTPPMPPRPQDVERRAQAVRRVLSYVKSTSNPILGLAPEGMDMPGGVLHRPPAGAGRFMAHLAEQGLSFVPVGCYEENGEFRLHFGAAYRLEVRRGTAAEREMESAFQVMTQIARLLPERLRGEFGDR